MESEEPFELKWDPLCKESPPASQKYLDVWGDKSLMKEPEDLEEVTDEQRIQELFQECEVLDQRYKVLEDSVERRLTHFRDVMNGIEKGLTQKFTEQRMLFENMNMDMQLARKLLCKYDTRLLELEGKVLHR